MTTQVNIVNGTGREAVISTDGELRVIAPSYPPLTEQKVRPFRQYLTDDGLANGSNDMGVDGSVNNVDFYIKSDPDDDRYITSISVIVAYASSGKPYLWADAAALTNGTRLFYESLQGEQDIHDGIKSNQDVFRLLCGSITSLWEVRHVNALNDYGYFISMDLTKMGMPFGIKLDRGSAQRLVFTVRDNATAAISFNAIGYGFDRFE